MIVSDLQNVIIMVTQEVLLMLNILVSRLLLFLIVYFIVKTLSYLCAALHS